MARFLFITDTHIGANPIGWHQQPAYPDHAEELMPWLVSLIQEHSVDFVLHGGDLVHQCTEANIRLAQQIFSNLPVPMYLSLGNHDLDREDALELWLGIAPEWFGGGQPQYDILWEDCVIHVVPNNWEQDRPYFWEKKQEPSFTEEQLERLRSSLQYKDEGKTHLLSIHHPIYGVPESQTGLGKVIHPVSPSFTEVVESFMKEFPKLRCVLSGHNHINTLIRNEHGLFVSGSSLVETPFECKLVEVTSGGIRIQTLTCDHPLTFEPSYNQTKAYVQGTDVHRNIDWRFF